MYCVPTDINSRLICIKPTQQFTDKWSCLEWFKIINMFPSTDKNDGTLGGSHSVITKKLQFISNKNEWSVGKKICGNVNFKTIYGDFYKSRT